MSLAAILIDMDDMHERLQRMLAECPERRYREADAYGHTTDERSPAHEKES